MKKIKSLFERNFVTGRVLNHVTPGCEWVINGEGLATRKFDGTCCMIKEGELYKRYDAKDGRTPPVGFIPAQEPDEVTGHWPGWVKVSINNPADKWFVRAFEEGMFIYYMTNGEDIMTASKRPEEGTYELCGPHFNKNPEKFAVEYFVTHGAEIYDNVPRTYKGLKEWFIGKNIEGIVWHHKNGDMVKIKKKDFGLKREE